MADEEAGRIWESRGRGPRPAAVSRKAGRECSGRIEWFACTDKARDREEAGVFSCGADNERERALGPSGGWRSDAAFVRRIWQQARALAGRRII